MTGWVRVGRSGSNPDRTAGQATVEAAMLLPAVVVVLLAVVQVGLVVHARIMVTHASREGVRVAAVGGSLAEVTEVVSAAGRLAPDRVRVSVHAHAGRVTVTVRYEAPTNVALVGSLVGPVTITGTAAMLME